MKISKLWLLVFVISVCVPAAFAQTARGLKYVPQAVKGAKAVPYVVKPNLSPVLRTNLAVPVVRPNVAAQVAPAVERAVAAKVTVQERLARLEKNLNALEEYARTHDNKLPQKKKDGEFWNVRQETLKDVAFLRRGGSFLPDRYPLLRRYDRLLVEHEQQLKLENQQMVQERAQKRDQKRVQEHVVRLENGLNQLEEFIRTHNNNLTQVYFNIEDLRKQIHTDIAYLKFYGIKECPLFQRHYQLTQLIRSKFSVQNWQDQLRQEKELAQQEKAWAELVAEEQQRTEAEEVTDANAATVAAKAESNVPLKGNTVTDDYVEQLLNFYNKLDPWGTGSIQ